MNNDVRSKLSTYPDDVAADISQIIETIHSVAKANDVGPLIESIKWGQISITSKKGSPIRIDWSQNQPQQISLYFNCNSKLVDTFKELYGSSFQFVGNRELVLPRYKTCPKQQLNSCISMALRYHQIKKLPMLGN